MDMYAQIRQLQQSFLQGHTKPYAWRRQQLLNLKSALYQYEEEIYAALAKDLKMCREEAWITEIGFVLAEINYAL